jgi:tyrosyl-tRNA synthetase
VEFLRDIGRFFSVNRMIKAESYRMRLESEEGLSFIEFNYMLLQAYDFLVLFDRSDCRLQMGGSDQWGNIVAGIDLIRRMRQETAFGITFPLITTASGAKMGKTAEGAVWLDADKTSPYDYFQYWVNTDDRDVVRFLALFTFLPMEEIRAVENLSGAERNGAKMILAFEATRIAHGVDEATKAYQSARQVFGVRVPPESILPSSTITRESADKTGTSIPWSHVDLEALREGVPAFKMFHSVGLASSGSAARRLIEQGGAYINGSRVEAYDQLITDRELNDNEILLRSGKKKYHVVKVGDR